MTLAAAIATFSTVSVGMVASESQVATCISRPNRLTAANSRVNAATARPGGIHAGVGQHCSAIKRANVFRGLRVDAL